MTSANRITREKTSIWNTGVGSAEKVWQTVKRTCEYLSWTMRWNASSGNTFRAVTCQFLERAKHGCAWHTSCVGGSRESLQWKEMSFCRCPSEVRQTHYQGREHFSGHRTCSVSREQQVPTSVKEVRQFLSATKYLCPFKNCSSMSQLLRSC